jgi:perosamine synthetase
VLTISIEAQSVSPAQAVLALLRDALPSGAPLHAPVFEGREWEYLKDCLDTGWVSSVGQYVDRFEQQICDRVGCTNAIATVSGTAALHALLAATGIGQGDEVILPALTFVATANAVMHAGAMPHFADIERTTLGIDPARLEAQLAASGEIRDGALYNRETGARVRAIVAVHIFGHPCDMEGLGAVARKFHLDLLEDAAESLGSLLSGRPTGAIGRAGILSFNGNKTVTTGGGGAIVTDDEALGKRIRHLTTTAKIPHAWTYEHDAVGFNYRMPNINAALGCAQMELLDRFLAEKRHLADWYRDRLCPLGGVEFVDEAAGNRGNFWLNAILMDTRAERDRLLSEAHAHGIGLRPAWRPMHQLPMYTGCPRGALSVTEEICDRLVNLPSGVNAARQIVGGS